ncbi:hypothetical protein JVU11DRAFT_8804 [Chiua virens]|nr:hypothetical protein JVU11DRAFT_8804 [Chiua virens]
MAIEKLLLLLLMTIGQSYVMSPPNVPPANQIRAARGFVEYVPLHLALFLKVLSWSRMFFEGSVLFAVSDWCPSILSKPILHLLVPGSATPATLIAFTWLTPTFVCGTLLALSGTLLRMHSFRTLGPRFTFELAIRPSHKLVTDGIYGVVRHPSYTGALGSTIGMFLCMLDHHGVWTAWARTIVGGSASASRNTSGTAFLVCVSAATLAPIIMWINKRMDNEERMLEKNFGDEWRSWAKRVPYLLIPGVY